jgi:hypothetical protein
MGGSRDAAAQTIDLSQYLWKNRLLFIFAPNRSHPRLDALHRALSAQAAQVSDRDLVIFEILESGPSRVDTAVIDSETARVLRERFNPARVDFKVVLVGKDGGVKLDRSDQTNLKDIFALIDAMPMRREEMRQKSQ